MSTLKDVMLILEIRPGMIMGRPGGFNLREIGIYINGFIHGCAQEGFEKTFHNWFGQFVQQKLNVEPEGFEWWFDSIYSKTDSEEEAQKIFYSLYEEFYTLYGARRLTDSFVERPIWKLSGKYEDFCWTIPDVELKLGYEMELQKEITQEHALYSKIEKLETVAYSERADDVIFSDGHNCFLVHLTGGKSDAIYPKYEEIDSLKAEEFLEKYYLER